MSKRQSNLEWEKEPEVVKAAKIEHEDFNYRIRVMLSHVRTKAQYLKKDGAEYAAELISLYHFNKAFLAAMAEA